MNAPQRLNTLSKQQLIYKVMALESANEKCSDAIAAAVQAEREACAKIADNRASRYKEIEWYPAYGLDAFVVEDERVAIDIRARSGEK